MHWYKPPQPGDIVECWFPQDKFPDPGPKNRPALVIGVDEFEISGQLQADVTVAYGTSVVLPMRAGHFLLQHKFTEAGLACDTKFDLTNQCTLPFNDLWFCAPPGHPDHAEPRRGKLPLEVAAIKKAFIAALSAAQSPTNQTAPNPDLARAAQKKPQKKPHRATTPKQ